MKTPMATDEHTQNVIDICSNIVPYFINTFFSRYVNDYKLYLGYKGDRAKQILNWQTNINVPLVPAIVDTMYSSMYDSKMKFNINGGPEGQDKLLNAAFDYKGLGRDTLLQTVKEAIITGKGFIKPYFNKYQENIMVNGVQYGKEVKRPELAYVSIFDVFYDYNNTIDNSPFLIERHIMSRKTIMKRFLTEIKKTTEAGTAYIDTILNQEGQRFSNYDYNRVRNILAYEDLVVKENKTTNAYIDTTVWERNKSQQNGSGLGTVSTGQSIDYLNNIFGVDFKTNKVYEVIEYTDDENYTVLIDGVKLFNKKNPDTLRRVYDISFNEIPGTSDSTGISSNIGDLQVMINTLQNIFLDGLKMNTSPMYEQVGGLNQMLGNKNKITYEPFKIIPTNTAGALKKIEMGLGGFEPVNAIQFLEGMAEKRVGVNEYIIGGQGKVERVSGGVDLIFNQYKSKLMPITNSVNHAMAGIAKAFLIMYAKYYTLPELRKMGLSEKATIADLINEDGVTFQLASLALLAKEEGVKNLLDNLGAISNFMGGVDSPNINSKELIKAILTKEVDLDKLLPEATQVPGYNPGGQGVAQQAQGQQAPQAQGASQLATLVNNLKPNP